MSIDINLKEYIKAPLRELSKASTLKKLFKTSCIFVVVNRVCDYLVRAYLGFPQTNYSVDYLFREISPGIILTTHDPIGLVTFVVPWVTACGAAGIYLFRDDLKKSVNDVYNSIRNYFKSRKVSSYDPIKPLLTEKDLKDLKIERV